MSLFLGPEAALNATPRAVVNPKGVISAHAQSSNTDHEYKYTSHEQVMLWCSVHTTDSHVAVLKCIAP